MPDYSPWNPERALELIVANADLDGPVLPILHALAETFGHVPDEAAPLIAGALNLSRAEVHGTLTFYHDFRRIPPPARVVKLCLAEACQARGSAALIAHADAQGVALDPIYCLGLCASGPAAMIDGRPHARLTPERFDALVAETA